MTRLKELEKERQSVEADKAQADKYKKLLLKQRDIMIGLTARLNERDEQIIALQVSTAVLLQFRHAHNTWLPTMPSVMQEELDLLEKHQRQVEDSLDQKTAELIRLRKAAVEQTASSAKKNSTLQTALGDWGNDPKSRLG